MEPVKIGQDTREYNRVISAQNNRILKVYQPLINEYHGLNISTLTTEDLETFFNNPKAFFVSILTKDEPLTIGTIKLQPEKVYDFMERPTGLDSFVDKLINYKIEAEHIGFDIDYLGDLEPFELVDNILQIRQDYRDELEYNTSYFAQTEKQLNAYNLITEIVSKIEEFNTIWDDTPLFIENDKLIRVGHHTEIRNKMFINTDQLLRHTK